MKIYNSFKLRSTKIHNVRDFLICKCDINNFHYTNTLFKEKSSEEQGLMNNLKL